MAYSDTDVSDVEITRIDYDTELHSYQYGEDGFDSFQSSPRKIEELHVSKESPSEGDGRLGLEDSSCGNSEQEDAVTELSHCESEDTSEGKVASLEDTLLQACEEKTDQQEREPSPRSRKIKFAWQERKTLCQERYPWNSRAIHKFKQPTSLSILACQENQNQEHPSAPLVAVHLELIRREGNDLFKKGDATGALNRYSVCIRQGESAMLDPSTSSVCKSLAKKIVKLSYSSRAHLMLVARMWDDVLLDTEKALKLDRHHVKSLVSRGKALHALQQFKQACRVFSAALNRNPNNIQVAAALHESMKSHHQSVSGEFDLSQFLLFGDPPPECSDYVGPVEVRASPYAGRGLFVTQRVKAGTLLVVSNAVAIASTQSSHTPADLSVKLAGIIMNLTKSSTKLQHQMYYLTSGKPEQENPGVPEMKLFIPSSDWSPDPQKNVNLSFIDVVKKVTFNTFDASRAVSDGLKIETEGKPSSTISSGMWVLPSFLNHSCIPNTGITFVGKAMFIRASRYIEAGEELTTSYTACSNPNRQKSIRKWNFECRCERCQHDRVVAPYLKELRKELDDYCSCFSRKKSSKGEKLRALFKSVDMVQKVESTIESLPIKLDAQKKNWVRVSFMIFYTNNMHVAQAGRDLNQKIQALQRLAEIEESINGGGVYYMSMRTSAELLRCMQKKVDRNTAEFDRILKQVLKVFRVALGNMGEIFFLELIRRRFSKNKSGKLVWLDYTK